MKVYKIEDSYQEESRIKWLLIILALLINLAILLFLFLIQLDDPLWNFQPIDINEAPVIFQEMAQQPPSIPPPPQFSNDVAALKPGASNFGTPDDLDELALQAQCSDEETKLNHVDESAEDTPLLPQKKLNEAQEMAEPSSKPESQTTLIDKPHENAPPHPAPKLPENKVDAQPKPKQEKQEPTIEKIHNKIKAPLKKEITFNDLAKGFLSSLDEGGNDLMERKGNENIRPDFEEMRTLSYLHKIAWYMQNEWRRSTMNLTCSIPPFLVTGISVTIDKNGNLTNASVVQSCGINQLDDAIIQGIRAASPYPPLPSFFKKDSMTFEFGVKHVANNPQSHGKMNFYSR